MDGTAARGELASRPHPADVARRGSAGISRSSALRFALATPADDAAIRRLLRENPMPGAITVTFEREPVAVGGALRPDASLERSGLGHTKGCLQVVRRVPAPPGNGEPRAGGPARPPATQTHAAPIAAHHATIPAEQVIVAYEDDRLVCTGRCAFRSRYINGELRRVGYLGELRLDARARRSVDLLRGGYGFFRDLQRADPADVYFTSIAADNLRAQRVLERGLPGLPRYDFLAEFVTLLVPVGRASKTAADSNRPCPHGQGYVARRVSPSTSSGQAGGKEAADIAAFLNTHATRHQMAAHLTADDLAAVDDVVAIRDGDEILACAALWDQRAWRQTVIRGYVPALARLRPFLNLVAPVLRLPRLPPVGAVVPAAFLSPLATMPGQETCVPELIRTAFAPARRRGVELLTLGFVSDDPRLTLVRRHFRAREYRTRLYRVSWPDGAGAGVARPELVKRADPGPASAPSTSSGQARPATGFFDGRPFLPEVALL